MSEPRFPIGTRFMSRGKVKRECRVIDILKTYNAANELVEVRYVAAHEFCGQQVVDRHVCGANIAIGLIKEAK